MTLENIPFHKPHITEDEIKAVTDVLLTGWLSMGPKTLEFEQEFRNKIGTSHALSTNSGTAALHLALKAIGLKPEDEVILPTNTFIATAEVVTYFNARPVLCDIEENTHNMDVALLEKLITKRTKAIIPVHFGGQPCDMNEIVAIANQYNLKIIEDAAHALPSFYENQMIGTIGDITCFSFYNTKTLSTAEGGMITTNNDDYARSIRINRLHGIDADFWGRYGQKGSWYYQVVDNGHKYNTTDINSALGLTQLKKLEWMWSRRDDIASEYTKAFSENKKIITLTIKPQRKTSWHLYVIKVNHRDELLEKLKSEKIGTSVHFIPVHKHPFYQSTYGYIDEHYPVANRVFEKSLSLPIYPSMTDEQRNYVIDRVLKYAT